MKKKSYNKVRRRTPLRRAQSSKRISLRGMIRLSHGMIFGLTLFSLFATYLFIVNDVAIKGTEIRTLERHIVALKETIEEREIEEAQLRSLAHLKEDDVLEFIVAEEIRIIAIVQNEKNISIQEGQKTVTLAVAE